MAYPVLFPFAVNRLLVTLFVWKVVGVYDKIDLYLEIYYMWKQRKASIHIINW